MQPAAERFFQLYSEITGPQGGDRGGSRGRERSEGASKQVLTLPNHAGHVAFRVAGFANTEEEAVHWTQVVPFLVGDELRRPGGLYEKAPDWQSFVIVDGRLVTGQNPAPSAAGAQALLKLMS